MREHAYLDMGRLDAVLYDHGSICILSPLSDRAREWVDANVVDAEMTWGTGIVIERRYVSPILGGLDAEGMKFEII